MIYLKIWSEVQGTDFEVYDTEGQALVAIDEYKQNNRLGLTPDPEKFWFEFLSKEEFEAQAK